MIGWGAIIVAIILLALLWTGKLGYLSITTKLIVTAALLGVAYWGYATEMTVVPAYVPTPGMMGGRKRYGRR